MNFIQVLIGSTILSGSVIAEDTIYLSCDVEFQVLRSNTIGRGNIILEISPSTESIRSRVYNNWSHNYCSPPTFAESDPTRQTTEVLIGSCQFSDGEFRFTNTKLEEAEGPIEWETVRLINRDTGQFSHTQRARERVLGRSEQPLVNTIRSSGTCIETSNPAPSD